MDSASAKLGGQWVLAVIMIVIGAWVVFKYLAPKSYKEWQIFVFGFNSGFTGGIGYTFITASSAE